MIGMLALALAAAMSQATSNSALVLGIRGASGNRTLVFTGSTGSLRLAAHWQFLMVPYRGGPCALRTRQVERPRFTYAAVGLDCEGRLGEPDLPADDVHDGCSGHEELRLVSASPQYLAFEIAGEAVCGSVGAAEYLRVARLSDFKDRWVFTQDIRALSPDVVWGPKAIDVFRSAAKTACRDYARSPLARDPETQIPGMPECSDELVGNGFSDWAVRIGSNALAVAGRLQAWRMNYLDFTVPLGVPPGYELAHVPPSQRRLLERILRWSVARGEGVVFLEWATGDSARRWATWATDASLTDRLGR